MPTPTYVAIAKTVLTGTQTNVEFTGIAQTYTDLVLLISARKTNVAVSDSISVNINSSISSYSRRALLGDGSTATSDTFGNDGYVSAASATSNTFGSVEVYLPNYTGSTNKIQSTTAVAESNTTTITGNVKLTAGLKSNTAAITSIRIDGEFVSGSRFDLYGIKNS